MSLFPSQSFLEQDRFLAPTPYEPQSYGEVDPDYSYLDRYRESQMAQQQEEEGPGFFSDLATGFVSGVEGFARSLISLADWGLNDALPDEWSERVMDRPEGTMGSLVEGITQFGLGMIPGLGAASLFGKAGAALGVAGKAAKLGKSITAGAVADFVAFDAHEARLSDFLVTNPLMKNAVTEYLASNEEDSQFEGRLKNMLEGGVIGGVTDVLLKSVKLLKKGKKLDGSEEALAEYTQTADELIDELVNNGIATREGIELTQELPELIEAANRRVRTELGTEVDPVGVDQQGATRTELDPESPIPNHPDC